LTELALTPDLDITAVTISEPETGAEKVSAMTVETGANLLVYVDVENLGDANAVNSIVEIYSSNDSTFTTSVVSSLR